MTKELLRLREHQAVVDHSGHSCSFTRAIVVNPQRNTSKRKIAEALFIKNHSTVQGNKSSFPLSIFKN